jgi:hypothetical protein
MAPWADDFGFRISDRQRTTPPLVSETSSYETHMSVKKERKERKEMNTTADERR